MVWVYSNNLLYIGKYVMTDDVFLINVNVYHVLM